MFLIKLLIIAILIQLSYLHICNFLLPLFFKGFCSIYGLRGTGKTSLAQILATFYNKIGVTVYSNAVLAGTYQIETYDLGVYDVSNGVLIIDEAGVDLSNRKILEKSMRGIKEENRKWWKLSRHYGVKTVIILSQAFDYDVTLRRICEKHFILNNWSFLGLFKEWTRITQIKNTIDVNDDHTDIVSRMDIVPFFYLWFNRKPSYGLYDSWEAPTLPHKDFEYIPHPGTKKGNILQLIDYYWEDTKRITSSLSNFEEYFEYINFS